MGKDLIINEQGNILNVNKVELFTNSEFGELEIVEVNGKFLFPATECAVKLGYSNPWKAIGDHCQSLTKREVPHPQSNNKTIEKNYIPEGDLYRLIVHSKLPSARKFESWVFDEVLPSIRGDGTYMTNEFIDKVISNPDLIIRMATELKQQREENQLLLKEKRGLEVKIEQDKPLVDLASSIIAHDFDITMSEMGNVLSQNGLKMGQNKLFAWMRNNNYLISSGECRNNPQQWAVDKGYLKLVTKTYRDKNGIIVPYNKTYITPKGQMHLVQKLLKQRAATLS